MCRTLGLTLSIEKLKDIIFPPYREGMMAHSHQDTQHSGGGGKGFVHECQPSMGYISEFQATNQATEWGEKKLKNNWVWWHTTIMAAFERQRLEV